MFMDQLPLPFALPTSLADYCDGAELLFCCGFCSAGGCVGATGSGGMTTNCGSGGCLTSSFGLSSLGFSGFGFSVFGF
jgi:hypothetical protein